MDDIPFELLLCNKQIDYSYSLNKSKRKKHLPFDKCLLNLERETRLELAKNTQRPQPWQGHLDLLH